MTFFDDDNKRGEVLNELGLDHNDQENVDLYNDVVNTIANKTLQIKKRKTE